MKDGYKILFFILFILIFFYVALIISHKMYLSNTNKDLRLSTDCIKEIKSKFCEARGGERIYYQVDWRVLCSIDYEEVQYRLEKEMFLGCQVPIPENMTFLDWINFEDDCNCLNYKR